MKKKLISILLSIFMIVTAFTSNVFANTELNISLANITKYNLTNFSEININNMSPDGICEVNSFAFYLFGENNVQLAHYSNGWKKADESDYEDFSVAAYVVEEIVFTPYTTFPESMTIKINGGNALTKITYDKLHTGVEGYVIDGGSLYVDVKFSLITIDDVLTIISSGFPSSSNDAWVGSTSGNIAYEEVGASTELIIKNDSKTSRVDVTKAVDKVSSDQYKYHDSTNDYDILFNMKNNVLTSITFDGGTGGSSSLNDTYKVKSLIVTFDPAQLGYCSLQVDGKSTTNYDNIAAGSSVKLSVGSIFPDFQLDSYECNGIDKKTGTTVDGNNVLFTMPDNGIKIKFNCSHAISNVNMSMILPKIGDTSMATPTINSGSNYSVKNVTPIDMSDAEPKLVDEDNKFASGKRYLASIDLYADIKNDYTFKCGGTLLDDNYEYKYDVNVKLNGEKINSWQSEADSDKTGYAGSRDDGHDHISIYYYFSLYEITEGDDATIDVSLEQPAVFKSNADKNKFVKVTINGSDLDSSNYTVTEGSTIVTLKSAYLKTLANGTYDMSIISTDGFANTQFTITGNSQNPEYEVPNTGVEVTYYNNYSLLKLSTLSLLAVGTYMVIKKKER